MINLRLLLRHDLGDMFNAGLAKDQSDESRLADVLELRIEPKFQSFDDFNPYPRRVQQYQITAEGYRFGNSGAAGLSAFRSATSVAMMADHWIPLGGTFRSPENPHHGFSPTVSLRLESMNLTPLPWRYGGAREMSDWLRRQECSDLALTCELATDTRLRQCDDRFWYAKVMFYGKPTTDAGSMLTVVAK